MASGELRDRIVEIDEELDEYWKQYLHRRL